MLPLPRPDHFHLQAAFGWLELENFGQAEVELTKIRGRFKNHPDVLNVRWHVASHRKDWQAALELALTLTQCYPEVALGWVQLAQSYDALGRTAEACELLKSVAHSFQNFPLLWYNLACYSAKLGNPQEAFDAFQRANEFGDSNKLTEMALADPDLLPMWDWIRMKGQHC